MCVCENVCIYIYIFMCNICSYTDYVYMYMSVYIYIYISLSLYSLFRLRASLASERKARAAAEAWPKLASKVLFFLRWGFRG